MCSCVISCSQNINKRTLIILVFTWSAGKFVPVQGEGISVGGMGRGIKAATTSNLGSICRCVVSFTPQSPCPPGSRRYPLNRRLCRPPRWTFWRWGKSLSAIRNWSTIPSAPSPYPSHWTDCAASTPANTNILSELAVRSGSFILADRPRLAVEF